VAASPEAVAIEQKGPSQVPLKGVSTPEAAEKAAAEESAPTGMPRKHDSDAAGPEKQRAASQLAQADMAAHTPSGLQSTGDGRAITPFAAAADAVALSSAGVCHLVLCCQQSSNYLNSLL
jgi:hypothetical protein